MSRCAAAFLLGPGSAFRFAPLVRESVEGVAPTFALRSSPGFRTLGKSEGVPHRSTGPEQGRRGLDGTGVSGRQPDGRPEAAQGRVPEGDVAAMRPREVAGDRKAEAGAALVLVARLVE